MWRLSRPTEKRNERPQITFLAWEKKVCRNGGIGRPVFFVARPRMSGGASGFGK
jgi:hypothetical protein